jgi:hypothetical protein
MEELDCLFYKPLQVTYIVKAAAPVQKYWRGNTVEAQLNNRSRGAMLKSWKGNIAMPKLLTSACFLRLFRMGGSGYLFYFLYFLSCPIFMGRSCFIYTWYLFISHFTSFVAQQCFFHSLFRMGKSDYLDDNLIQKHFSRKKEKFFSYRKKEFRRRSFSRAFYEAFFIEISAHKNVIVCHDPFLAWGIAGLLVEIWRPRTTAVSDYAAVYLECGEAQCYQTKDPYYIHYISGKLFGGFQRKKWPQPAFIIFLHFFTVGSGP